MKIHYKSLKAGALGLGSQASKMKGEKIYPRAMNDIDVSGGGGRDPTRGRLYLLFIYLFSFFLCSYSFLVMCRGVIELVLQGRTYSSLAGAYILITNFNRKLQAPICSSY